MPNDSDTGTRPIKRLEIVVDSLHLDRLLQHLRAAGATGYTVLHNASGFGASGTQRGDDVSGVSVNACVLVAVPPDIFDAVIEATRATLRSYGGVCLVSDAQWLEY
ncbi:MAG: transcriptional regulator [Phycisphaerales bacterium]|nr:transcriptional regulator [Phycisphaerales bacterium]